MKHKLYKILASTIVFFMNKIQLLAYLLGFTLKELICWQAGAKPGVMNRWDERAIRTPHRTKHSSALSEPRWHGVLGDN